MRGYHDAVNDEDAAADFSERDEVVTGRLEEVGSGRGLVRRALL